MQSSDTLSHANHNLKFSMQDRPLDKELESPRWGKAAVGRPFSLTTRDGPKFTEKDLF